MPGAGLLTLTGQLGSVMKESARAALSWLRANASRYGVDPEFYGTAEMHLHVPAGATPKDGPSAGVAMAAALASELTGRAVRDDRAMTGEITLSGDVLPVGGVKEKVLAARRLGIAEVILPKRNARDVDEHLGGDRLRGIGVRYVSTIDEVLELALSPPTTRGAKSAVTGRTRSARRGSATGTGTDALHGLDCLVRARGPVPGGIMPPGTVRPRACVRPPGVGTMERRGLPAGRPGATRSRGRRLAD